VFLTSTGGLLDQHGNRLPSINLAEDYELLMNQPWVHSGMRLKLQEIKELLDELPPSSSVSITKPDQLARELFTHKGSGTLVRRGEGVALHTTMEGVDQDRVRDLLENCFQRRLADNYFEDKPFYRIYLTESYRACAILTRPAGVPYLDKFGVTQKAQGEGLGGSVWSRMRQENPILFWRSRSGNPINAWYFQQSDGAYKSGDWTVFWYGLKDYDAIRECVERALAMPPTLYAHHAVGADE
jgi:bifunctional N-acetylglutamate synthase/kinase